MSSIQKTLPAKQYLLHRYIHNLQLGIDCLNTNVSEQIIDTEHQHYAGLIELPVFNGGHPLKIHARSINSPAWQCDDPNNFPILLSDEGQLMKSFLNESAFDPFYLNAWQILICAKFNAILDLQAPEEVRDKYGLANGSLNTNLTSLAYYQNLEQRLCSFVSFMATAKDVNDMYFQTERE